MPDAQSLIFDPHRVALHMQRASEDFLLREMMARLADRLPDINRSFPRALDLSAKHGVLSEYLPESAGVETLVDGALAEEVLVAEPESFDLVISAGVLHWVNDLPGVLAQIGRALKPDGLFLAMLPGGETLTELRQSFEAAEMRASGGVSPRVSPFVDIRDAGALLQRAGFALPVADSERLDVHYTHPLKLLHELRNMGQSNAMIESRKGFTPCSLIMQMADHYMQNFSTGDGRVRATFELITLTGWRPHASQQKPARRGSGKVNLSILSS